MIEFILIGMLSLLVIFACLIYLIQWLTELGVDVQKIEDEMKKK